MISLRRYWAGFWMWYDQYYLSGTPVLGPLTGGKWMQMSPKAAIANLFGILSNDTSETPRQTEEYKEGCEIDGPDPWRKPIVTPEEFCNLVNANTELGMTWEQARRVLRSIESAVELE